MKVRKPRDINSKCDYSTGFYANVMENGGVDAQTIVYNLPLKQLRRLHNWLGRYIAWREQEEAK